MEIIDKGLKFTSTLTKRSETKYIVIHHPEAAVASVEEIHRWHLGNGWAGIGYNLYVRKDGTVYNGRGVEYVGAHAQGYNSVSVGVCCEGDYHATDQAMPDAQYAALVEVVRWLQAQYPDAVVAGHRELMSTSCPGQYFPLDQLKEELKKEVPGVAQTVQKLDHIWVQEIEPLAFGLHVCDCKKRSVGVANYFNAGFFASLADGSTIPVGNLAADGQVVAQAADNPCWINVAGQRLSTIVVTNDEAAKLVKTDRLDNIAGLRTAVSGIPIIKDAKRVSLEEIRQEGYDGSELYDTWHGFLGLRHGKLVYVATKCDFGQMCWILVALGIYDAIKLDGGGSFLLYNGKELAGTSENRRINNVGMWS